MRGAARGIGLSVTMFALIGLGGCRLLDAISGVPFVETETPDSTRGDTTFYSYLVRGMPESGWRDPVRFATFDGRWHERNLSADEDDRGPWVPVGNYFVLLTHPTADSVESAWHAARARQAIAEAGGIVKVHTPRRSTDPAWIGVHRFDVYHAGGAVYAGVPASVPVIDFLRELDARPGVFRYVYWPCVDRL